MLHSLGSYAPYGLRQFSSGRACAEMVRHLQNTLCAFVICDFVTISPLRKFRGAIIIVYYLIVKIILRLFMHFMNLLNVTKTQVTK